LVLGEVDWFSRLLSAFEKKLCTNSFLRPLSSIAVSRKSSAMVSAESSLSISLISRWNSAISWVIMIYKVKYDGRCISNCQTMYAIIELVIVMNAI
jgi:hypothetical protein